MTKEDRITLNDLINPLIDGEAKISIYKMAQIRLTLCNYEHKFAEVTIP